VGQVNSAREGLFDARGQAVKGLGFAVLFAPFGIALLVVEKLAHQWDEHAVLEAEVGFQHIDMFVLRPRQMIVGAPVVGIDGGSIMGGVQETGLKIASCTVLFKIS
jgi:H2-forming N5,N10-methylenetetrahydromethanopterin dehydrogenase-like enzyme